MIRFPCKYCGKRIRAPKSMRGKWGRCPKCKCSALVPKLKKSGGGFWRELFIALLGGLLALVIEYKTGAFAQTSPDDQLQQETVELLRVLTQELRDKQPPDPFAPMSARKLLINLNKPR